MKTTYWIYVVLMGSPTKRPETFKLFALDSWLSQQPNRSVVFLIDNYDAPLLRSKHDKALFKCIGNTLNEFFRDSQELQQCHSIPLSDGHHPF